MDMMIANDVHALVNFERTSEPASKQEFISLRLRLWHWWAHKAVSL